MKILSFYKYRWQSNFTNIDGSSDMECNGHNFLSFWTVLCPFTSQTIKKIKILKKWEKKSGDIIHMCTINDNHMMNGSWDMECERQNFLSFGTIFCAFTPPNNPKNQNFEKMKKKTPGDIILHKCTKNHDQNAILFLRYGT